MVGSFFFIAVKTVGSKIEVTAVSIVGNSHRTVLFHHLFYNFRVRFDINIVIILQVCHIVKGKALINTVIYQIIGILIRCFLFVGCSYPVNQHIFG